MDVQHSFNFLPVQQILQGVHPNLVKVCGGIFINIKGIDKVFVENNMFDQESDFWNKNQYGGFGMAIVEIIQIYCCISQI